MGKEKKDFKSKPKASFKKGEPRFVKQTKTQIDPTTKEMRSLYNKLMQNTKSDKSLLIKKILSIIGENYENYCYKHDGCRVLQGCLKYGSKEQRNKIIESLMPFLFKIICGKYSIYLGNKIFKYSDNEQKKKILEDIIKPNFINLLKYSGGITFTKTVFMYSNTNYQDELIDLYIKEYFKIPLEKIKLIKEAENLNKDKDDEEKDEDIKMKDEENEKKDNIIIDNSEKNYEAEDIIKKLKEHLEKQLEKNINKNFIFHGFLNKIFDYLDEKTQIYITELFDDDISFFMDSYYGYELIMKMYSISSAKTRKKIIKYVRDKMDTFISDEKGTYFIIKIILFTDDTVSVNKIFMNAIMDKLDTNMVENKNCLKIIWNIISPFNKKCNNVQQQNLLNYSSKNSNKKSLDKRQKEILDNIFEKLFKIVNYGIRFLIKDILFSHFLTDFILFLAQKNEIEKLENIINNIIQYLEEDYKNNKDNVNNCALADKVGQFTVKRIFKDLIENEGEANKYGKNFAEKIAKIMKPDLDKFLDSRAVFLIVMIMENKDTKTFLSKEIEKFRGDIMKNKDNEKLKGMQLLSKLIN
jgi:pumilio family protein 6